MQKHQAYRSLSLVPTKLIVKLRDDIANLSVTSNKLHSITVAEFVGEVYMRTGLFCMVCIAVACKLGFILSPEAS
jgi:hypothetical protein